MTWDTFRISARLNFGSAGRHKQSLTVNQIIPYETTLLSSPFVRHLCQNCWNVLYFRVGDERVVATNIWSNIVPYVFINLTLYIPKFVLDWLWSRSLQFNVRCFLPKCSLSFLQSFNTFFHLQTLYKRIPALQISTQHHCKCMPRSATEIFVQLIANCRKCEWEHRSCLSLWRCHPVSQRRPTQRLSEVDPVPTHSRSWQPEISNLDCLILEQDCVRSFNPAKMETGGQSSPRWAGESSKPIPSGNYYCPCSHSMDWLSSWLSQFYWQVSFISLPLTRMAHWWPWASYAKGSWRRSTRSRTGWLYQWKHNVFSLTCNECNNYTLDCNFEWLRRKGREMAAEQKHYLATIVNINDVHWAALVINFEEHEILFGDSYQNPIPSHLRSIVNWWTFYHTGQQFTHSSLAIARQQDSFSCGMLTWNALQHYLLPSTTLMDGCHRSIDHTKMFLRLTKDYCNQVRTSSRVT